MFNLDSNDSMNISEFTNAVQQAKSNKAFIVDRECPAVSHHLNIKVIALMNNYFTTGVVNDAKAVV